MRVLSRKLLRDLRHMKGQSFAIALLVSLAAATFVGSASTHRSLQRSRDAYYADCRFAHVFAQAARVPLAMKEALADLPGVESVEVRVAGNALVEIPGFDEPASARLVGLPGGRQPDLGRIHLREGRLPEAGTDEAVVSEALATAQRLRPGDGLHITLNGRRRTLAICGIGLSAEHVYEVRPGDLFPDNRRYGILWVDDALLRESLNLGGSFNEAVFFLQPGANEDDVIAAVDRMLQPFGGFGAFGRDRHISARFLSEELKQLEAMAYFVPAIFLFVAVFLLNIIIGRLVTTQREQIATMKALGIGNTTIGLHYLSFTLLVVAAGVALGGLLGWAYGLSMTKMYAAYYRFARFTYSLSSFELAVSALVCILAGITGTLFAVRQAVRMQPAQAMRPLPPAVYQRSFFDRIGVGRLLSPMGNMVLRNLLRRPVRALLSSIGISMAVALLIVGMFFVDAMDLVMNNQFRRSQRQDLTVNFNSAVSRSALFELSALPGVSMSEPQRQVAVELRRGHRSFRTSVGGLPQHGDLQRILSIDGRVVEIPEYGLMLSETLADNIGARVGDTVEVKVLEEGRRETREVVTAIADEPFGTAAYSSIDTANALAGTGSRITAVLLKAAPDAIADIHRRLQQIPAVMSVTSRQTMLASFDAMVDQVLLFFAFALSLFAGALSMGVVYNAARISLSEKERELATMRVIGMTQGEIFTVLAGELVVLTAVALPLGVVFGHLFAQATAEGSATEMYRIPVVVSFRTMLFAVTVVAASAVLVSLIVRRRLRRLDLVSVLKTKE